MSALTPQEGAVYPTSPSITRLPYHRILRGSGRLIRLALSATAELSIQSLPASFIFRIRDPKRQWKINSSSSFSVNRSAPPFPLRWSKIPEFCFGS
ncbi:hypothetical protein JTE90_000541 [Oedothorax gibbosus]|uniref:Uncharacterized protein n=1 Tax=Oedothorax gibbosus TaxID=931172 RepID=A0AAV6VUX6_9ARAC|nr:hypothetical protein JTE90_000541 [Oedothorax gibbosus]